MESFATHIQHTYNKTPVLVFFERRNKSVDDVSCFSRTIHKATKKTLILWLVFRWKEVNRRTINLIVAILSLDRNVLQLTPMFSHYSAYVAFNFEKLCNIQREYVEQIFVFISTS